MMGFCTTKFRLILLNPCNYDLFTKVKKPLQGTWHNTRDELIHAIGQSIWNINKDGCTDGVRCLSNIWQKVINKIHECCSPVNKSIRNIELSLLFIHPL